MVGPPGAGAAAMKDRHIEICLTAQVESAIPNGFERYRLEGGLPDFAMEAIDTATELFGRRLSLPLFVSSMTGGGGRSGQINRRLAEAAQARGIGLAVGSQSLMLKDPSAAASYQLRSYAPDILLFADLGLVHLNYGLDRSACLRAVEEIEADALMLYVNHMHEAFQAEGDLNFGALLPRLATLLEGFPYPVVLKEVGFGFAKPTLRRLIAPAAEWASVVDLLAGLDVAGLGGTHWGRVESFLAGRELAPYMEELGTPTADSLASAVEMLRGSACLVLASGGIRNGVEIAKSLAMGAAAVGMGLPFLRWADESTERVVAGIDRLTEELRLAMWYAGARDLTGLAGKVIRRDP